MLCISYLFANTFSNRMKLNKAALKCMLFLALSVSVIALVTYCYYILLSHTVITYCYYDMEIIIGIGIL